MVGRRTLPLSYWERENFRGKLRYKNARFFTKILTKPQWNERKNRISFVPFVFSMYAFLNENFVLSPMCTASKTNYALQ